MTKNRINPYTGLPPKKTVNLKVVPAAGIANKYVIKDTTDGRLRSKPMSLLQVDMALQHTINSIYSSPNGKVDEIGQALVNFSHENRQPPLSRY